MITWQTEFLDNLVWRWVLAFFITLGTVVIVYVIRRWILRYLRPKAIATATKFDDAAILVVRKTTFLFLLIVSIPIFACRSDQDYPPFQFGRCEYPGSDLG